MSLELAFERQPYYHTHWGWQKAEQMLWLDYDLEKMSSYMLQQSRWHANQLAYFGCLLILVYEEIADV